MNRRWFLLFLLFLTIVFVGIVVFVRGTKPSAPASTPAATRPTIPAPAFPTQALLRQPSYVFGPSAWTFPTQLAVYEIGASPAAGALAGAFAQSLGFTGAPSSFSGSRGEFFYWQQRGEMLSVGGDPIELSYTSAFSPATTIALSVPELARRAEDFLTSTQIARYMPTKKLVALGFFAPARTDLVVVDGLESATVVEVNWRYELDGFPLYSRSPSSSGMSVRLNSKGEVLQATGYLYPSVTRAGESVSVVSADVAAGRLRSGQGVLVHAFSDADKNSVSPEDYLLSSSTISNAELGYYSSPGKRLLAPVYVFYGEGVDGKSKKGVHTTTVVSALPDE